MPLLLPRPLGLLGLMLCFSASLAAQNPPNRSDNAVDNDNDLQVVLENAVEAADGEEFTFDTQFENLEELLRNPLDLNNADEAQLNNSGLFSALQIRSLLEYRRRFGQIYTLYELAGIPNFDRNSIARLLPYVQLAENKALEAFSFKTALSRGRSQLFLRYRRVLEQAQGFSPLAEGETGTRYEGSPDQLYLRYRFTYKDRLSMGITAEKDPGEAFFRGSNRQGFDFYSAHLYIRDLNSKIKTLALGDYQVFLGQGLTMWGGFGIRKSPNVLNIKRVVNPIKAYTSANEALFQRGAAVQIAPLKNLDLVLFASYRQRDGSLSLAPNDSTTLDSLGNSSDQDTGSDFAEEVSSLPEMGLHRTPNEIAQRNTIGVFNTGGSLRYRGNNWTVAANLAYTHFNKYLDLRNRAYQTFAFAGQNLLNASLDYTYIYKHLQFFGETALSSNGGWATLNGLLLDLDPKVKASILYRNYARDYQAFFGNAFGETQNTNNEQGFYTGLELHPAKGLKISTFFDVYRFPWLRYLVDGPSHGYEFFSKAEYQLSRRFNVYMQYRFEEKGRNLSNNETALDLIVPSQRQSLRFHLNSRLDETWSLRSRVEFSRYSQSQTFGGVVLYQDFIYRPQGLPLSFNARLAFFDTDNYDTRIYAYENDVLYQFSVPAYYGKGMRYYLNCQYSPFDGLTFWLRFSQTYFSDRETISSGLGEINGPRRSEVKIQMRYKF